MEALQALKKRVVEIIFYVIEEELRKILLIREVALVIVNKKELVLKILKDWKRERVDKCLNSI